MPDTFSHTLYLLEYRVQHYSIAIPSDLEDFLPLSESIKKAHKGACGAHRFLSEGCTNDMALNAHTREHSVTLHIMLTVSAEKSVFQDSGPRSDHDFIYIQTFYTWSRRAPATLRGGC